MAWSRELRLKSTTREDWYFLIGPLSGEIVFAPREQMFKSRNLRTIRMAALDRLLQLVRGTKQNNIFRGLSTATFSEPHLP